MFPFYLTIAKRRSGVVGERTVESEVCEISLADGLGLEELDLSLGTSGSLLVISFLQLTVLST